MKKHGLHPKIWQKRLTRKTKRWRSIVRSDEKVVHEKDFSWSKHAKNPFQRHIRSNHWRSYVVAFALGSSLFSALGIWMFHPYFSIHHVEISGVMRISVTDIRNSVEGYLQTKKWKIFPRQSYVLLSALDVEDLLREQFPIDTIEVKKKFPGSLTVLLKEKMATIIYDNGIEYSYIGLDGKKVQALRPLHENEWEEISKKVTVTTTIAFFSSSSLQLTTNTQPVRSEPLIGRTHTPQMKKIHQEMGDYPLIYDIRDQTKTTSTIAFDQQLLDPILVTGLVTWYDRITTRSSIPWDYIVIQDDKEGAIIRTKEGWGIYVLLDRQVEEQFVHLQALLKEKIQRPHLQYIDLRYGDRLYWQ